uniref:Uncharacterized protein n=1 Tax=Eutreptiella gymnastica TaxID=73025 RepID=A0A7S4GC82_9EUGL
MWWAYPTAGPKGGRRVKVKELGGKTNRVDSSVEAVLCVALTACRAHFWHMFHDTTRGAGRFTGTLHLGQRAWTLWRGAGKGIEGGVPDSRPGPFDEGLQGLGLLQEGALGLAGGRTTP